MRTSNCKNQAGFTLVELSIVLVIIGLIISSVLVGQDIIRGAEIRATISQVEAYNTAVGTFKGKYNGLPGDVAGQTNFGFVGDGGGNGVLLAATTATGLAAGENVYFWNHLGSSGSGLISGTYAGTMVTDTLVATQLPATKLGNYWGVFAGKAADTCEVDGSTSEAGTNYFILGATGGGTTGAYTTADTLTPLEAKNIDSKIDDGKPSTGIVRARHGGTVDNPDLEPTIATSGITTCLIGSSATYLSNTMSANRYTTAATTALCTLRIKMAL